MQEKPRVGLVLMQSDWMTCVQAQEVAGEVNRGIQNDHEMMVTRLRRQFEVVGPWVIKSAESLEACQRGLRDTEMDLVLVAYQTYSFDSFLVSLIPAIGSRPLVLWCYLPWRRMPRPASYTELLRASGPVGAFAALGTLRNLQIPFLYTFGAPDDPRLLADLQVAGSAARTRLALRGARFGLIPARDDRMQSTLVDEQRLLEDFGPTVQNIPIQTYKQAAASLDDSRVEEYLSALRMEFPVREVADETMAQGARAALALAQIAADYRLDVLSVNDALPELHGAFGLRPGLYPDLTAQRGSLYQPDADLGAAAANLILRHLTGSPTMFLELWFWDEARNLVVGGHSGVQNPRMAEHGTAWVGPDIDICRPGISLESASEGAQMQFAARSGRATLFQLRGTPRGWQAIAASGMCLEEGQPWVTGFPHAVLRLDTPLNHFLNQVAAVGASPHWVLAYGSVLHELEAFCEMENVPLEVLTT